MHKIDQLEQQIQQKNEEIYKFFTKLSVREKNLLKNQISELIEFNIAIEMKKINSQNDQKGKPIAFSDENAL